MVETTGERLLTGEDDTRALGAELAGLARPGLVVLLVGDLGAGIASLRSLSSGTRA